RLRLTPQELFVPATGAPAGRACVVLGEAVAAGPGERGTLVYGPEARYDLGAAADLCRLFSRPKQVSDREALRKAGEEASRKARVEEELRRQDRVKAEQAAVEASRARNDPMRQVHELRQQVARLEQAHSQAAAAEAEALRARLAELLEAEKKRREPPAT